MLKSNLTANKECFDFHGCLSDCCDPSHWYQYTFLQGDRGDYLVEFGIWGAKFHRQFVRKYHRKQEAKQGNSLEEFT